MADSSELRRTLAVYGLPSAATVESLLPYLAPFGEVKNVQFAARDASASGRTALATYAEQEDAEAALDNLNYAEVGAVVRVEMAQAAQLVSKEDLGKAVWARDEAQQQQPAMDTAQD